MAAFQPLAVPKHPDSGEAVLPAEKPHFFDRHHLAFSDFGLPLNETGVDATPDVLVLQAHQFAYAAHVHVCDIPVVHGKIARPLRAGDVKPWSLPRELNLMAIRDAVVQHALKVSTQNRIAGGIAHAAVGFLVVRALIVLADEPRASPLGMGVKDEVLREIPPELRRTYAIPLDTPAVIARRTLI